MSILNRLIQVKTNNQILSWVILLVLGATKPLHSQSKPSTPEQLSKLVEWVKLGDYPSIAASALPISNGVIAQEASFFSLMSTAIARNIDINISDLAVQQATLDWQQSKLNLTPSLTGNAGQFYQSGRSIDRFTNQFVQKTIGSNNFQLQGSWVLYAGGQNRNALQQSQLLLNAALEDKNTRLYSVLLQTAQAYVQWLQALEQEKAAETAVGITLAQVARTEVLFKEGAANKGTLLNIKAQHANNINTLANARNSTAQFLLQLKQFLRIPYSQPFAPIPESLTATEEHLVYLDQLNPMTIMDTLLVKRPDLKAAQFRKAAALESISIAKGALAPTLSIGANLNTVYSDNAKRITGYSVNGSQAIGWVPSTMEAVYAPVLEYNTETIAFSKQLKDNFGQSIGLNLSIPIYSGLRGHNQISAATIAYKRAELTRLQIVQNAENEINQAVLSYKNARSRMLTSQSNLDLQRENRDYVKARFSEGAATAVELQIAESNYINANFNLISAQHDLYFRAFVLDFYLSVIQ